MNPIIAAWSMLVGSCAPCFTQPSADLFAELARAWILCPGRHTVTHMISVLGSNLRRTHDAYHRFLRAGAWNMADLWFTLARILVQRLTPEGPLPLDLDDTLFHRTGRRVEGAGIFRDAVRSCGKRVVYALGLNLVVLTFRVTPPWEGEPLGLPINVRLYRKGGPSHLDLAEAMLAEVAGWFPGRRFELACDGAYASLAGRRLPRTQVTSRMRRDAALYEAPRRPRKRKRGRPARKGKRLPTPEKMAARVRKGWTRARADYRGRMQERLIYSRPVLWYKVCPSRQVLLVIVRDPRGQEPDDFFFTTDLQSAPAAVASQYAGRWSIEDTFRNVKQLLGGEDPQTWRGQGPERAASLSMWLYAAIWVWYITTQGSKRTWVRLPWYTSKKTPSFADALAGLRRVLWRDLIFVKCALGSLSPKITIALIEVLARAA